MALTPDPSPERERGTAAAEMPEIAEAEALLAAPRKPMKSGLKRRAGTK